MKHLLFTLFVLVGGASAFAGECVLALQYNLKDQNTPLVQGLIKIAQQKGYETTQLSWLPNAQTALDTMFLSIDHSYFCPDTNSSSCPGRVIYGASAGLGYVRAHGLAVDQEVPHQMNERFTDLNQITDITLSVVTKALPKCQESAQGPLLSGGTLPGKGFGLSQVFRNYARQE